MKKVTFLATIFVVTGLSFSQTMDVHKRDQTTTSFPLSQIDSITFSLQPGTTSNITWTKYANNPVIDKGTLGSWDDLYVSPGGVILDGSTYKMWYWAETTTPYRKVQIGLATSPDGINWTKYANNPVLTENPASGNLSEPSASAPYVLKEGSVYRMWYLLTRNIGGVWIDTLKFATSFDGINWTKSKTNLNHIGGNPNLVVNTGSTYRIWAGTITATSSDGINWSNQSNLTLPSGSPGDQGIVAAGPMYRMFYRNVSEGNTKVHEARSTDGITFTEFGIAFTGGTGWDPAITGIKLLWNGSSYYMYYNGYNVSPGGYKIGLAIGTVH